MFFVFEVESIVTTVLVAVIACRGNTWCYGEFEEKGALPWHMHTYMHVHMCVLVHVCVHAVRACVRV